MRLAMTVAMTALALVTVAHPAKAQLLVTGIIASFPDPNSKVPAFNAVPGAGIPTFSDGFAQGVLTHGQAYDYCVTLASGTAQGTAEVSFKIKRGSTTIQSGIIVKPAQYSVGSNSVWVWCSGYKTLPSSPGAATMTGTVSYVATGSTKHVASHISVPVLLQ